MRSLSSIQLLSNPGEKFSYVNMAFKCQDNVIAKVSQNAKAEPLNCGSALAFGSGFKLPSARFQTFFIP